MKRILMFALAAVMLFTMVACSSAKPVNNGGNNTQKVEPTVSTDATKPNDGPFNGLVAIDNAQCAIRITELEPDNQAGYTVKVELENKSAKSYMFCVEAGSVNGLQFTPSFDASVTPGSKVTKDIVINDSVFAECDIGEFTDIELSFLVYEVSDWDIVDVAAKTVHIYPFGADKATTYVRTAQESDNTIVDDKNFTVVVTGYEMDKTNGYSVNLFIINKAAKAVIFSLDKVSVNDKTANPFYATTVAAKRCAYSSITWSNSVLKENGISSVEEIAFVLHAIGYDDWTVDGYMLTKDINLNP